MAGVPVSIGTSPVDEDSSSIAMLWHPKCTASADDRSSCRPYIEGSLKDSLHEPLPGDRLLKNEVVAGGDRLLAPTTEDHILQVDKSDSII